MRAELDDSFISPEAGVAYAKEGVKGVTTLALMASVGCIRLDVVLDDGTPWERPSRQPTTTRSGTSSSTD